MMRPWMLLGPPNRGLATTRKLFTPLTGNKEDDKRYMALHVRPTFFWFPMDSTPLHSIRVYCLLKGVEVDAAQFNSESCRGHHIKAATLPMGHMKVYVEVSKSI